MFSEEVSCRNDGEEDEGEIDLYRCVRVTRQLITPNPAADSLSWRHCVSCCGGRTLTQCWKPHPLLTVSSFTTITDLSSHRFDTPLCHSNLNLESSPPSSEFAHAQYHHLLCTVTSAYQPNRIVIFSLHLPVSKQNKEFRNRSHFH
jgi:hypothetical protein